VRLEHHGCCNRVHAGYQTSSCWCCERHTGHEAGKSVPVIRDSYVRCLSPQLRITLSRYTPATCMIQSPQFKRSMHMHSTRQSAQYSATGNSQYNCQISIKPGMCHMSRRVPYHQLHLENTANQATYLQALHALSPPCPTSNEQATGWRLKALVMPKPPSAQLRADRTYALVSAPML